MMPKNSEKNNKNDKNDKSEKPKHYVIKDIINGDTKYTIYKTMKME